MREIPILFSTEMVNAILAGRKTQTRRIIGSLDSIDQLTLDSMEQENDVKFKIRFTEWIDEDEGEYHGPEWVALHEEDCCYPLGQGFGQEGDLFWVREAHFITWDKDNYITILFRDGVSIKYYYKDLSLNTIKKLRERKTLNKSWTTGRFLPKELARIWLTNENTRVERLQDITEEDAIEEGVEQLPNAPIEAGRLSYKSYLTTPDEQLLPCFPYVSYRTLWQKINGRESWDSNPWVWAITFKVISTTGKPQILNEQPRTINQQLTA